MGKPKDHSFSVFKFPWIRSNRLRIRQCPDSQRMFHFFDKLSMSTCWRSESPFTKLYKLPSPMVSCPIASSSKVLNLQYSWQLQSDCDLCDCWHRNNNKLSVVRVLGIVVFPVSLIPQPLGLVMCSHTPDMRVNYYQHISNGSHSIWTNPSNRR